MRDLGDYWVVIPANNEARTIREVAARALGQIPRVIVVDDGSDDGTGDALVGLPVVLLRNRRNRGKAQSLWRGFRYALRRGARGVLTLDGDGQHAPEDIGPLLAAGWRRPGRLVIGTRARRERRVALSRYCANRFADFWISWAAGYAIADSQSGFRLYPAELLQAMKLRHDRARSFVFESEVLIEAARLGFRAVPVPIAACARKGPRPSHFRPLADIARITAMVAGKILARGLHLGGLYRYLRAPAWPENAEAQVPAPGSAPRKASRVHSPSWLG